MEGWIKLSRCLIDKPIFQNEKLLKVWVWCLLKATHKGYEQLVGLQKVWLDPGQFIFGRKKAAEELSITESTVWRLMQFLADKNNPSLEIVAYSKYSVITIVNWAGYQVEKTDRCEPSNDKASRPFQEQQMDSRWTADGQQMDTNKNVKNDKNEKKNIYGEFGKVKLTDKEYEKLVADYGIDMVDKLIKFLDEYIGEKAYKSKSHNLAIRRWVVEAVQKKQPTTPQQPAKQSVADKAKEAADRYAIRHGIQVSNTDQRNLPLIKNRY